jgi:N6-adenosine-specific RNA methylase IME4
MDFGAAARNGFRRHTRVGLRLQELSGMAQGNHQRQASHGMRLYRPHENILIGSRGKPKMGKPFPSLFDGVAREHSRKPDEFYALAEAFAPDARRLDLFGRQSRAGWDVWGVESTKFDETLACGGAPLGLAGKSPLYGASPF